MKLLSQILFSLAQQQLVEMTERIAMTKRLFEVREHGRPAGFAL
jgi:hypothetical protein